MYTLIVVTLVAVLINSSLGLEKVNNFYFNAVLISKYFFSQSNCRSDRDCPRLSSGSGMCKSHPFAVANLLCAVTGKVF